ncbi:MAG: hypothetical protein AB7P40_14400 [Chloroflexota bacterium]
MSLQARYQRVCDVSRLDKRRVDEIIQSARPHAAALLADVAAPVELQVTGRLVSPADATGGSLIPAWPRLNQDGSATIEYVADWGVLLAGWSEAAESSVDSSLDIEAMVTSGDRLWVGIANDVLQMFVPNPPAGTYSMVRHHALMLGAATLWLGPERARLWQQAHGQAARGFLASLGDTPLWDAVAVAEQGLARLLADPRGKAEPDDVLTWLDGDASAAAAYRAFHGAASLGIAALLATAPQAVDPTDWLRGLVHQEHPHPDFNRDRVEAFAASAVSA